MKILSFFTVIHLTAGQSFVENWSSATSPAFVLYSNPTQGSTASGHADPSALDGRSLKLTLHPNPPPGVGGAPAAETYTRYLHGSYWARARTANCSAQPRAGVVTGIFTYFNDGSDSNGNGLPDNSELDFEWLCAKPEVVHLSIWTDYLESTPPQLRVAYRSINVRTGAILEECYRHAFGECRPLAVEERQPTTVSPLPTYDPVNTHYEYGIILEPGRVRFLIVADGRSITLWDYQGASQRVPQIPMHFMHNVWHTNDWTPIGEGGAVEAPRYPVEIYVDNSRFVGF